jgi:ferrous iron transport protein B
VRPAEAACHGPGTERASGLATFALVGNPNVGKSALFNALTGAYVVVSNYPGTTVDVTYGKTAVGERTVQVVDTPGMYSLMPITEEERVARTVLLRDRPDAVVHVVDARNLPRMLPLTLQLVEAGLPAALAVNMVDEAEREGMRIDAPALEAALGIPVVLTSAVSGRGVEELKGRLASFLGRDGAASASREIARYEPSVEAALAELDPLLEDSLGLGVRSVGLLILQGDSELCELVTGGDGAKADVVERAQHRAQAASAEPLAYRIAQDRQSSARRIAALAAGAGPSRASGFAATLSRLMIRPLTGVPLLIVVLYFGLYQFVGVFGAGTLVGLLEKQLFGRWIGPFLERLANRAIPWDVVRQLLVGDYGLFTLGLRYAVAIILPIVGTFFLVFSVLEDTGYFPRLAMLVDVVFKRIGLNGRAVIPMVLGFGCDTMATIVTRTLETRRERAIATLLLALAIPCSAQLGVILSILSFSPRALFLWAASVLVVFLLVGFLAARLLPGPKPAFYMELPPLRLPKVSNVLVKTASRMQWYLKEIIPLFLLASVLIWAGKVSGLFDLIIRAMRPAMRALSLPDAAAFTFLFGFFRRDYGAAGLYDLRVSGLLSEGQLIVAAVTLTLFIPCVAQFAVMWKERGWKTTLAIVAFVFPFAFLSGAGMSLLVRLLGIP